jgi:hypothetical protein
MDPSFTPDPEELTDELCEAADWIRAELARLASEKELSALGWSLEYGERRGGGTGGVPVLRQWGYQVRGVGATGAALALHCFLEEQILLQSPELAARILDLWMDRLDAAA